MDCSGCASASENRQAISHPKNKSGRGEIQETLEGPISPFLEGLWIPSLGLHV